MNIINKESFPESFFCPLTHELFEDPVVDHEGNSYERGAIEDWLQNNPTSPITRNALSLSNLVPNRALYDAIVEKKQHLGVPHEDKRRKHESKGKEKVESKLAAEEKDTTGGEVGLRVSVSAVASSSDESSNKDQDTLVVLASTKPAAGARVPSDVVCVVDVSGSMATEATIKSTSGGVERHGLSLLDIVKHAVKTVIESLNEDDRLALVTFATTAKTIFSFLVMDAAGKKRATKEVTDLVTEDSTNIWDGISIGLDLIRKESAPGRNSSLLLLTDGQPNVTPPRGELGMLKKYREDHQTLSTTINTFGFGYGINSKLLRDLSLEGLGSYSFIPDSSFVGTAFVHTTASILTTFAKNVVLSIEPINGASLVPGSVLGHKHQVTSWGASVDLCSLQWGQSKDAVFSLKVPSGKFPSGTPFVNVTIKYEPFHTRHVVEVAKEGVSPASDSAPVPEIDEQRLRLLFAQEVTDALKADREQAKQTVKKLIDEATKFKSNPKVAALIEDLTGQVTEAFAKPEFFDKWGQHYLPSLARSHLLQQCNNFKDPGIQHYGGALFKSIRDTIDAIFVKLPPPKPSVKASSGKAYAPVASMSSYHRSSNPCYHPDSLALMADGTSRAVGQVRKGDLVAAPGGKSARVLCVIKTHCHQNRTALVELPGGLKITPYHPVRIQGKWKFPMDLEAVRILPCPAIYSFVLDSEHVIIINGVETVTLGHSFNEDLVRHAYFGSTRVVEDLKRLHGWNAGIIEFSNAVGCLKRDDQSGLVIGFQNEIRV